MSQKKSHLVKKKKKIYIYIYIDIYHAQALENQKKKKRIEKKKRGNVNAKCGGPFTTVGWAASYHTKAQRF